MRSACQATVNNKAAVMSWDLFCLCLSNCSWQNYQSATLLTTQKLSWISSSHGRFAATSLNTHCMSQIRIVLIVLILRALDVIRHSEANNWSTLQSNYYTNKAFNACHNCSVSHKCNPNVLVYKPEQQVNALDNCSRRQLHWLHHFQSRIQ